MQVGNEELIVENFKTHLKDRNLIKFKDFDTIESIERLREKVVSISDKYKNDFSADWQIWDQDGTGGRDKKARASIQY